MKKQYLFGFICKMPTHKEIKLLLDGKSEELKRVIVQSTLPKTADRICYSTIFRSYPYNFSAGFEKVIRHIYELLEQKKNVTLNTFIIKTIQHNINIEKQRTTLSLSGEIVLPYEEMCSGLGGSWSTTHQEEVLFTLNYKKGEKEAYLFLDMKH